MSEMEFYQGSAYEETVSAVTATPSVDLGSRRFYKGEEYVYCYNAGGASIGADVIAKFVTGCSGYSVAATALTDVFSPAVGVAKNGALSAADYGWLMTKGFASVKVVSAMTGDYVGIAIGEDGYAIQAVAGGQTGVVVGAALNANTAASGSAYCMIRTGL